jgi:outer membrane lipoprotein-sorting protein
MIQTVTKGETMQFRLACLLFVTATAFADDSTKQATDIITEMERLYRGNASRSTLTMTIRTPNFERHLTMTGESMGQDYGFYRILSPKKDHGIATLKREKEMWNYFPKINKVIKVPPSMMTGSWMGSDFTNDDLLRESELVDAYNLELEETEAQYLIILTPREDTVTVWGKIEYVVDKKEMLPLSHTFYDERGVKIRIMEFGEITQFEGVRLPSSITVTPLNKQGHSTAIVYDNLDFEPADISEQTFTLRNLKSRF